jgi:hypothetical protein
LNNGCIITHFIEKNNPCFPLNAVATWLIPY